MGSDSAASSADEIPSALGGTVDAALSMSYDGVGPVTVAPRGTRPSGPNPNGKYLRLSDIGHAPPEDCESNEE